MSELVLYRKYRPATFDDIVGQEHVVTALQNAIKFGRVAHAYLFSGPRGVGKTSVARILARALNCEGSEKPCGMCDSCKRFVGGQSIDVIEIDGASTGLVDDIRELRDGVRVSPTQGRYKCYIIDEVHMLSKGAFNALLKTLEEPPAHAIFILATTELEKILATVVSRTQHYQFRRPTPSQIAERLSLLAKKEKVTLDEESGRLIAFAAEGSLRDAESILGQILSAGETAISRQTVENILGMPHRESAKKLFEYIAKKDARASLEMIQQLSDAGHDIAYFSKLLLQYFRCALFLKTDPSLKKFVEDELLPDEIEALERSIPNFAPGELPRALNSLYSCLQSFRRSPIPQLPLEVAVVEIIGNAK